LDMMAILATGNSTPETRPRRSVTRGTFGPFALPQRRTG
jgi:hypothetical protein